MRSTESTAVEMSSTSKDLALLASDIHNMINQLEETISNNYAQNTTNLTDFRRLNLISYWVEPSCLC